LVGKNENLLEIICKNLNGIREIIDYG
jgi:hypothetical protein